MSDQITPGIYQLKKPMTSVYGHQIFYIQVINDNKAVMLGRGIYLQQGRGPGGEAKQVPPEHSKVKVIIDPDNDNNPMLPPSNWTTLLGAKIEKEDLPPNVEPF